MVDPMAHKYPTLSPYVYCANNPLVYIDPDGMEVRGDSTELAIIAESLNTELKKKYGKDANIEAQKRKTKELSFTLFGKKIVISESKTYFALNFGKGSNLNLQTDKITSALGDVINSKSTIFNAKFTEIYDGDDIQEHGGGGLDARGYGGNISLSRNGFIAAQNSNYSSTDTYTESIGLVFMHEAVGHGHPVGNTFGKYGAKGIQRAFGARHRGHGGYTGFLRPTVKWKTYTRFPGVIYK